MRLIDTATRRLARTRLAGPLGALMGLSLAFLVYAMPGTLIGGAIADLGGAALLPLGPRSRLGLMIAAGAITGGVVYALFRRLERPRRQMPAVVPAIGTGPAVGDAAAIPAGPVAERPSLLGRLRRARPAASDGELTVRRADAHPDAPVRRPISAGSDLGAPFDAIEAGWTPDAGWNAHADGPSAEAIVDVPVIEPVREAPPAALPVSRPVVTRAPIAPSESTADLMARLERALASRPGRPSAPPRATAQVHETVRELRRAAQRG